jgi:hypothetical protein
VATHRYSKKETDWGFSVLLNHQQLKEKKQVQGGVGGLSRSILENGGFLVRVLVKQVFDETGYLWHKYEE